jgi:hypothetical protein
MEQNHLLKFKKLALHQTLIGLLLGTIIFSLSKVFLMDQNLSGYLVEILMMSILIIYSAFYYLIHSRDAQNKETCILKIQYGFGLLIFVTSFFMHFYSLSRGFKTLPQINMTSLMLLLIMVVLIFTLKKYKVSLHYDHLRNENYIKKIVANIFIITVIFSINLIPIFHFNQNVFLNNLILTWLIVVSIYVIFSIYEKIDQHEHDLLKEGKIRYMSATVLLFLLIPTVFSFIEFYFNNMIQYEIVFKNIHFPSAMLTKMEMNRFILAIFVFSLFAIMLIYQHLKKINLKLNIRILFFIYIVLFVVSFSHHLFSQFFMQRFIDANIDNIRNIGEFVSMMGYISIILAFSQALFMLGVWVILLPYRLKGHLLFLASSLSFMVTFFIKNLSLAYTNEFLYFVVLFVQFVSIPLIYIFLFLQTKSYYILKVEQPI